jgi:hypothetical protein
MYDKPSRSSTLGRTPFAWSSMAARPASPSPCSTRKCSRAGRGLAGTGAFSLSQERALRRFAVPPPTARWTWAGAGCRHRGRPRGANGAAFLDGCGRSASTGSPVRPKEAPRWRAGRSLRHPEADGIVGDLGGGSLSWMTWPRRDPPPASLRSASPHQAALAKTRRAREESGQAVEESGFPKASENGPFYLVAAPGARLPGSTC